MNEVTGYRKTGEVRVSVRRWLMRRAWCVGAWGIGAWCVGALALAGGCAPTNWCAKVGYAADKFDARDAAALRAGGFPQYRFDEALRAALAEAGVSSSLRVIKSEGERVLTEAQALAARMAASEIDRLPPSGVRYLARGDDGIAAGEGSPAADVETVRNQMKVRFTRESASMLRADITRLRGAEDVRTAQRILQEVSSAIEAPVGDRGRVGRALIAAPLFLPAAIGAEIADTMALHRVIDASFSEVVIYRPARDVAAHNADELARADDEQLARWFAPVFVQQRDPDAVYAETEDQFGEVRLAGERGAIEVTIDVAHPTVYWATREARFHTENGDQMASEAEGGSVERGGRKQLIYATWYPSRPALVPGDSQAGRIDGVVIRITLDRLHRPAIYEFVRSCGCYHMLFISEFLEAEAGAYFGQPLPGKAYAIQREGSDRELFIPSLVADDGATPRRPLACISAGHHMLMAVESGGTWSGAGRVMAERTYQMLPYETLTRLPLGPGVASMFDRNGLVHDAGRAEGWLLAPTGMRSAGQPRQLGTMKIRMDAYDYDDPYLLDRQLRIPPEF